MTKKRALTIIISIILTGIGYGVYWVKDRFQTLKLYGEGELVNTDFKEEIPFEFRKGHIIIKAKVNGKVYPFILDTGAGNYVFSNHLTDQSFDKIGEMGTYDANGASITSDLIKLPSLEIGNLKFKDLTAQQRVFNFPCLDDVVGIIGRNTLRHGVWQIDYQQKVLHVSDNIENLQLTTDKIPAHVNRYSFTITVPLYVNDSTAVDFMLDTGSNGWISTNNEIAAQMATHADLRFLGASGNSLGGYNGAKEEKKSLAKSMTLGTHTMDSLPVHYAAKHINLIGNAALKNYLITISWKDGGVWLDPIPSPKEPTPKSFGFRTKKHEGKVLISSIVDFKADASGIKPGDQVIAYNEIDLTNADDGTYCQFRNLETKSVALKVLNSENDTITYTFAKTNLFAQASAAALANLQE